MFTGIIEEMGVVKSIRRGSRSVVLEVEGRKVLVDTNIGDSISTNGVCLTVTAISTTAFSADVMPETMSRSNLGLLGVGDSVNLERALTLSSRVGGHIVSGHIDGTGKIIAKRHDDNAIWISIAASSDILRYIIGKGSIAIDGISLTVAELKEEYFSVSLIPLTQNDTTLATKRVGEVVNLENDMIAKYVERLLVPKGAPKEQDKNSGMTLDFLVENGF